jgi:hypothetical protein
LRRWFPLFDTLPVTLALSIAFFFARHRRPVNLLGLPPRPLPRRLPAWLAAIALARFNGTKTPIAAFQQTAAPPGPADAVFPPAVFPILGGACRILDRAHGSAPPGKLMPRRGRASSPGRSRSGFTTNSNSIAAKPGMACLCLSFSRPWRRGCAREIRQLRRLPGGLLRSLWL